MASMPTPSSIGGGGSSPLVIPDSASAGNRCGSESKETAWSPISPSSPNTLARFEFEPGRGNDGSKVLMVEWDPSYADSRKLTPEDLKDWEVSWEGKTATFALNDNDDFSSSSSPSSPMLRIYFLLRENASIPPSVTMTHKPTARTLVTKCMPGIFTPGLGVSQPDTGKRGVLHTIWAKKRLAELQDEINKELQDNSEGVALEMALQERQWVIDHFGLEDPYAQQHPPPPPTPQSPRSPIGGRLGEKLRGLKLATSPNDLNNTTGSNLRHTFQPFLQHHSPATVAASGPQVLKPNTDGALASLDAVVNNAQPIAPISQSKDTEDDLFALPMSPRSPEMKASPFSFLK
ncbi:hypothetical protein F5Y16DRAFT_319491 [Xylariaceae sp. FL0255]|nr:hypothetical protein F5Y16DRAFT_319491 [Xylariaceae sp. FL0255]